MPPNRPYKIPKCGTNSRVFAKMLYYSLHRIFEYFLKSFCKFIQMYFHFQLTMYNSIWQTVIVLTNITYNRQHCSSFNSYSIENKSTFLYKLRTTDQSESRWFKKENKFSDELFVLDAEHKYFLVWRGSKTFLEKFVSFC